MALRNPLSTMRGLNIFPTMQNVHDATGKPRSTLTPKTPPLNTVNTSRLGWQLLAEFVGTLLFQMIGGAMGIGAFNGIILMVLIFFMGPICSAAFNPAVALGLALTGNLTGGMALLYAIAEMLGAIAGAAIGGFIFYGGCHMGDYSANKYGLANQEVCWADDPPPYAAHYGSSSYQAPADYNAPQPTYRQRTYDASDQRYRNLQESGTPAGPGSGCAVWLGAGTPHEAGMGQVFLAEFFGTFLLMMTIIGVAIYPKNNSIFSSAAPIAIGFALFCSVASFGSISGGAFNPARQIAPAVIYGCGMSRFYVYWAAEFLGAGVAAIWGNSVMRAYWDFEENTSGVNVQMQTGSSVL